MTHVIVRVHPVHTMNAEQRQMASDLWTQPANLKTTSTNFSTAGKIAGKDRASLGSSTVEASVLVAQAIKKNLVTCDYTLCEIMMAG